MNGISLRCHEEAESADLQGARQDAVDNAAAGDGNAAADSKAHYGTNAVQPCCCHFNGGNNYNTAKPIRLPHSNTYLGMIDSHSV